MKLSDLYARALADAQARETPERAGVSGWVKLPKGAQFAVKARGDGRQVHLSRQHRPVGFPVEEATFCRHFGVPASARRTDHGREEGGWHRVSYAWRAAPAAPAADAAPLPLDEGHGPAWGLLEAGEPLPDGL